MNSYPKKKLWLFQDVPKLRRSDVKYTLHLLLRVVNNVKIANPTTAQASNNTGANSSSIPGTRPQQQTNNNFVKIGFLGLRVLLTCYGDNLTREWLTIAATIRCIRIDIIRNPHPITDWTVQEIWQRLWAECCTLETVGLYWCLQNSALQHDVEFHQK